MASQNIKLNFFTSWTKIALLKLKNAPRQNDRSSKYFHPHQVKFYDCNNVAPTLFSERSSKRSILYLPFWHQSFSLKWQLLTVHRGKKKWLLENQQSNRTFSKASSVFFLRSSYLKFWSFFFPNVCNKKMTKLCFENNNIAHFYERETSSTPENFGNRKLQKLRFDKQRRSRLHVFSTKFFL